MAGLTQEQLEIENQVLWNVLNETKNVLQDKCEYHTVKIKKAESILNRAGYYIKRSLKEGVPYEFPSQKSRKRFLKELEMIRGRKV